MNPEKTILTSNNDNFKLTNRKVRYTVKNWGQLQIKSLLLKKITSIEIKYTSNIILLGLGILALIIGVLAGEQAATIGGIIIGIVLLLAYSNSRKKSIKISSSSASIAIPIENLKNERAVELMDEIEKATHTYKRK